MGVAAAGDHAVQSSNTFDAESSTELAAVPAELQRELSNLGDAPSPAVAAMQAMRAEAESPESDRGKLISLSAAFIGGIAPRFGDDACQAVPGMLARLGALIASLD